MSNCKDGIEEKSKQPNPVVKLKLVAYTSDKLFAGTKAKVSIWLTDTNGKTRGPLLLENYETGFDRNTETLLEIELQDDFDELHKISVKTDGSVLGSMWHLNRIEVTRVADSTKKANRFIFNRWIKGVHKS